MPTLCIDFASSTCEGIICMTMEQEDMLCNKVELVSKFLVWVISEIQVDYVNCCNSYNLICVGNICGMY